MKVRTAVVLAGGAGERMYPLTLDLPKAMLPLAGKPILHWVIDWLAREGIERVVIGVAHKREKVVDYFQDGSRFGVEIEYSTHTVGGGTAQGFKLAIQRHVRDDVFLAMNGDELSNVKLDSLSQVHMKNSPIATVCVSSLKSPFGVVVTDAEDRIVEFKEKAVLESVQVSIGVYLFQREICRYLPDIGDIERTAFVSLAQAGKLRAYRHTGLWLTVNTLKDLREADQILSTGILDAGLSATS
jgi:NDP-sugar pyrophosphorylase family protein